METHAWAVDRGVVDAALLEYRSRPAGSGNPRPEWKHVPSTLESDIHLLDPDCLTASRDLISEQKIEEALGKLVNKVPKFPPGEDLSEDDKVNELETFSRKVPNLLDNKLVQRARRQVSCTGEGYIVTVSDILWKVAEECLGAEQREFVEKATGGVGTSTGWMRRYADAAIFFGDLALSMLAIEKLQKLRDGLTRRS
ncbi:hypothetical protein CYMTET_45499 [Cymbomonas tetramitiformis]|uniref:Uncharacterized protein n=1 Tax=Cymbomonas tetramitiformis TaxID=36881 RepID=A0AAE0EYK2_9CHLO|nr:hypothetical protein CYMTET_45499 [Cymbomonas tetramitiformis]